MTEACLLGKRRLDDFSFSSSKFFIFYELVSIYLCDLCFGSLGPFALLSRSSFDYGFFRGLIVYIVFSVLETDDVMPVMNSAEQEVSVGSGGFDLV